MTDSIQNEVVPNKDSNSLMVFSFLLVGTSFMIFLLFIDYLFTLGFLNGMLVSFKSFFTMNEKLFIPVSILVGASIYGIGFIIYCLSLPLLSVPCYAFLNKFRSSSFKCVIITSLINASATSPVLMQHVSHHVGYVYLYLRTQNTMLSREIKFLFNQIMFARASLFALVASCFILFTLFPSFKTFSLLCASFVIAMIIYCYSILFWDGLLSSSFYINREVSRIVPSP